MLTCEFCQTCCTTLSNLRYHQKHTKTCLEIQGCAQPPKPICRFCGESYSKPPRLRAHEEKCDKRPTPSEEKMSFEIEQLDGKNLELGMALRNAKEEITRLREENIKYQTLIDSYRERFEHSDEMLKHQLSEITQIASKRSKVTHKTVYNQSQVSHNHLDLSNTDQLHSKLSQHLNHDTIAQGQVGIAKMVVKNILTTVDGELLYVCTDQDRHIFRYVDHEGKEVKDIRAGLLKDALKKSGISRIAVQRSEEMWTKEDGSVEVNDVMTYHPKVVEIGMMGSEEHDHRFRNELARLTTLNP